MSEKISLDSSDETSNFIYSFASIKRTSNRENDNE